MTLKEDKRNQHSANTSIPIFEWMQNFELRVCHGSLEHGILILPADIGLPVLQFLFQNYRTWRHKPSAIYGVTISSDPILDPRETDPVLYLCP